MTLPSSLWTCLWFTTASLSQIAILCYSQITHFAGKITDSFISKINTSKVSWKCHTKRSLTPDWKKALQVRLWQERERNQDTEEQTEKYGQNMRKNFISFVKEIDKNVSTWILNFQGTKWGYFEVNNWLQKGRKGLLYI